MVCTVAAFAAGEPVIAATGPMTAIASASRSIRDIHRRY
jgi:inosine-uridine nucleoside N-ribohydrolase